MSYYSTNHFARLPGPSEAVASRSRPTARRGSSQQSDWAGQHEDIFGGVDHLIDRAAGIMEVKTPPMEADRHRSNPVARQKQSKPTFGLHGNVGEQNAKCHNHGFAGQRRPSLPSQQTTFTTEAASYPSRRNPGTLMSLVPGAVTSEVVRNDGGAARGHAGGHGQAITRVAKYEAHTGRQGGGSCHSIPRSPSSDTSSVSGYSPPPLLVNALGKRGPQQSSKKQLAPGAVKAGEWFSQNPPPRDANKGKRRPAPGTGRGAGGGRGVPGTKAAMARSHSSGGRGHDRGRSGRGGAARVPSMAAAKRKEEVVTIDDDDEEVEAITVDTMGESGGRNAGTAKRQKREEGQGKCRKGGKDAMQDPVVDGDEGAGDSREEQDFYVAGSFCAWSKDGACLRGVDAVTFGFGRDDAFKQDQNADDIPWDTAESMVNCTLQIRPWQGLSLAWGARDRLCTEPHGRAKIESWGRLRAFHVFHSSDASKKPARGRSGQDGKAAHEDEKVYVLIAEAADKAESPGVVNIYALELPMSDETLTPQETWLVERKVESGRLNRNALKMAEERCIKSDNHFRKCYRLVKGEDLEAHKKPGTPYAHMLELLRRAADRATRPSPTPTDNGVVDVSSTPLKSQDQEPPRISLRKSTRLQSKAKTRASSSWPFLGADPTVEAKLLFRYPLTKETDRVSITDLDMDRLDPGEFLNDNIIDFFFKFMLRDYQPLADLRDQLRNHVHIFSTHFFSKLTEEVDDGDEGESSDDALPLAEEVRRKKSRRKPTNKKQQKQHIAAHKLVHRWTKSIDIFDRKLVLVPINEALHWSLAVMCNLDEVGNLPEDQVKPGKKEGGRSFQISPVNQAGAGRRRLSQAEEDAMSQAARTELESQGSSDVTLDDDTPPAKRDAMQVASTRAKTKAAPNSDMEEIQRMDVDEDDQQGASDSQQSASVMEAPPVNKAASTGLKVIHVDLSTPQDEHEEGTEKGERKASSGGGGDGDDGSSGANDDDDEVVPGGGKMSPEEQQVLQKGRPCILFMDSLGAHRADKIYGYLLNYLEQEWKKKKSDLPLPPINRKTVPLIKPEVPKQSNSCDCGVFVLMYGERVLRKLVEMGMITDAHLKNRIQTLFSGNEFGMGDVGRKRKALQKLFQELKEQWDAEHTGKRQGVSKEGEGRGDKETKESKGGEESEVEGGDEERDVPHSPEVSRAAEAAEGAAAERADASVAVSSPPRAASPQEPQPEQLKDETLVGESADLASNASTVTDDDAKPSAVTAMEADKDDVNSAGSIVIVKDDDEEEQDGSKSGADAAVELMDDDDDGGKAEVKSADGDVAARRRTKTPPPPHRRVVTRGMAAMRASPNMAQGGASTDSGASREATPTATRSSRTVNQNKGETKKRKRSGEQARGTEKEERGDVVQSDDLQGDGGTAHRQLGPLIEVASDEGEEEKHAEEPEVAMITSPQSTGKGPGDKAKKKRGRPAGNKTPTSPRSTAARAPRKAFSPVVDLDDEAPATQASSQAGGETVDEQNGMEEDADDAGGHTAQLENDQFLHDLDTEPATGVTIDLSED